MMFSDNNKAIYLQIADRIGDDIVLGKYPDGARLPSVRELAADMEVNANTVMRSYETLSQAGIIFNKRGIGFFVATGAQQRVIADRRQDFLHDEMPRIFRQLEILGTTPTQLAELYQKYLNKSAK